MKGVHGLPGFKVHPNISTLNNLCFVVDPKIKVLSLQGDSYYFPPAAEVDGHLGPQGRDGVKVRRPPTLPNLGCVH